MSAGQTTHSVVFRCRWARPSGTRSDVEAEPVRVACIGQVSAGLLIRAIEKGAERAILAGCPEGECRHQNGVRLARVQVRIAQDLLHLLGLDPQRIRLTADDETGTAPSGGQ